MMKKKHLLYAALLCTLLTAPSLAQEKGMWRAASTTARSITGDIAFSDIKLTINFSAFTIAQIRNLTPAEVSAMFRAEGDTGGTGDLFRLSIPGSRQFLHHNTLCGADETQWVVTYVQKRNLQLAFFSGTAMPVLTPETVSNATNLCGTFSYVR